MSKAEEKAMQYCCTKCANNKLNCGMKLISHGRNCIACSNYIDGYHQAEKDLELSWEDIRDIIHIFSQTSSFGAVFNVEKTYKEVLKRYKERKKK